MALYRTWVDARCAKSYTGIGIVVDVVVDGDVAGHHETMLPVPRLKSVVEAELMAVFVGIQFLKTVLPPTAEPTDITIFSDNDRVLKILHNDDKPRPGTKEGEILALIVDATKDLASPLFHINYNRVISARNRAHAMAAKAKKTMGNLFKDA